MSRSRSSSSISSSLSSSYTHLSLSLPGGTKRWTSSIRGSPSIDDIERLNITTAQVLDIDRMLFANMRGNLQADLNRMEELKETSKANEQNIEKTFDSTITSSNWIDS